MRFRFGALEKALAHDSKSWRGNTIPQNFRGPYPQMFAPTPPRGNASKDRWQAVVAAEAIPPTGQRVGARSGPPRSSDNVPAGDTGVVLFTTPNDDGSCQLEKESDGCENQHDTEYGRLNCVLWRRPAQLEFMTSSLGARIHSATNQSG